MIILQRDGEIWEKFGIHSVQYEHCLIGAGESYVKELEAKKGQTLVYEYFANRNFEIRVENGKSQNAEINQNFSQILANICCLESKCVPHYWQRRGPSKLNGMDM